MNTQNADQLISEYQRLKDPTAARQAIIRELAALPAYQHQRDQGAWKAGEPNVTAIANALGVERQTVYTALRTRQDA